MRPEMSIDEEIEYAKSLLEQDRVRIQQDLLNNREFRLKAALGPQGYKRYLELVAKET
jgi:hypothetical protein